MRARNVLALGGIALVLLLGLGAAVLAMARETGRVRVPAGLPLWLAALAFLLLVVGVVALVHALYREGLTTAERAVLGLAVLLVPAGGLAYWALGARRTRDLARRAVALVRLRPRADARA